MRHAIVCALSWWSAASLAEPPSHYERARVVAAEPIYSRVEIRSPERHCRSHDWRQHDARDSRAVGAIVGATVGAAAGSSLGHRRDRHLGAALGAVAGAAIGAQMHGGRPSRHCETFERVEHRDEITGYDITYEYRGRLYHTQSSSPPGRHIELAVYAEPLVD